MLHELQREFISGIYKNDLTILNKIDDSKCPAQTLLTIYQDSVQGGLLNALTETFPVTKKLLGEDFFNAMSMNYINVTPSTSMDINDYGETFSDFVQSFEPAKELVYLPDVMRLEWAWHTAYQANNVNYDDLTRLISLPLEMMQNLQLILNPTASLLYSKYPIQRIWSQNQPDINENNPEEVISLDEGECYLLIWRENLDMRIDMITEDMFDLLSATNQQHPLGYIQNTINNSEQNLSIALGQGYFHKFHVQK